MKTNAERTAMARVRAIANTITRLADIAVDETADTLLPRKFAGCLVAPRAELVIAPCPPPAVGMVALARSLAQTARSDVLAVTIGSDHNGIETAWMGVVIDEADRPWAGGYRLWTDDWIGPYWLASESETAGFCLSSRRLERCAAPWRDREELEQGIAFASMALARSLQASACDHGCMGQEIRRGDANVTAIDVAATLSRPASEVLVRSDLDQNDPHVIETRQWLDGVSLAINGLIDGSDRRVH